MTLSAEDSRLVSERQTLLTDIEHNAIVDTCDALYAAAVRWGVPLAMDDRAAAIEAALIRYVIASRPAAAPAQPVERSYVFLSDPGHGWLEVPLADVVALGVAKNISAYSYLSKDGEGGPFPGRATVYLEEDCDTGTFTAAAARAGWRVMVKERRCDGDCFCRRLPAYTAP